MSKPKEVTWTKGLIAVRGCAGSVPNATPPFIVFHLVKNMFPPVDFKGNLPLLEIFVFSRGA